MLHQRFSSDCEYWCEHMHMNYGNENNTLQKWSSKCNPQKVYTCMALILGAHWDVDDHSILTVCG